MGKSVIFGLLTGKYVTVSNYPGTTVEVSKGVCKGRVARLRWWTRRGRDSLIPLSEDERVARDLLWRKVRRAWSRLRMQRIFAAGCSLPRSFAEMGLPIVLVLNMWDELLDRGMNVDVNTLQKFLNVPIIKTIATHRVGISSLLTSLSSAGVPALRIDYGALIEEGITKVEEALCGEAGVKKRALAIMLLSGDDALEDKLKDSLLKESLDKVRHIRESIQGRFSNPLSYVINIKRASFVDAMVEKVAMARTKGIETSPISARFVFHFLTPLVAFLWDTSSWRCSCLLFGCCLRTISGRSLRRLP